MAGFATEKPIVIFGAGIFAQVVATYLEKQAIAFTVDKAYMQGGLKPLPVVPFETIEMEYPPDKVGILIAVTQQNRHRFLMRDVFERVVLKGYPVVTFASPDAFVSESARAGTNVLVCPKAIVEAHTQLLRGVIIRTGAYIGHHVTIGAFSYIAPRASIAGRTVIGQNVFIGNNATVRDRVTIGDNAVIGAGATILKDVPPSAIIKAPEGIQISFGAERIDI